MQFFFFLKVKNLFRQIASEASRRSKMHPWALSDFQKVIGSHIWSYQMILKQFLKIEFLPQNPTFCLVGLWEAFKSSVFMGTSRGSGAHLVLRFRGHHCRRIEFIDSLKAWPKRIFDKRLHFWKFDIFQNFLLSFWLILA